MKFIERPNRIFGSIFSEEKKPLRIWVMLVGGILASAIYGLMLGNFSGGIMFLFGAIKVPLVILTTLLICFPAMFLFSYILGERLSAKQIFSLVLSNVYMLALGLFAQIAVIWFTQNFYPKYRFNVIVLVFTFSFAWIMSVYQTWKYLKEKVEKEKLFLILGFWIILFAFVSTQVIWLYRPWVGYTYVEESLPFLRPIEGDIYSSVYWTIRTWMERNLIQ